MEERQRIKKEREAIIKKEQEEKKKKEDEEKRLAEIKDKEDFKTSIGKMVESQMRSVCEEVLGRRTGEGERPLLATTAEICRRTDAEAAKSQDNIELLRKDEEITRLKQAMAEMQRQTSRPNQSEQELISLKMDNQHLIQDVISLKEQVGELVRAVKPTLGGTVAGGSTPTTAEGIGKTRNEPTHGDYVKLANAYRKLRDDKDMAEQEVQALKEGINKIGAATTTPTSAKRKRTLRKSVSPPANLRIRMSKATSPARKAETSERTQVNVEFVKMKNETCEVFKKRVCIELSKLKKKEIEKLCEHEKLEYVTIRTFAAEIADIYTDRAFGKRNDPPTIDNTEASQDSEDVMKEDAEAIQKKIMEANFDFNDFLKQTKMMAKMGSMSGLLKMIPGMNKVTPQQVREAEKSLKIMECMIQSMTQKERSNPDLLASSPSRRRRVAKGSGRTQEQVSQLVSQLFQMRMKMKNLANIMQGKSIPGLEQMEGLLGSRKPKPGTAKRKKRRTGEGLATAQGFASKPSGFGSKN
ncbi:hypothetical protein CBR_g48179 [Chara braunii]|uniref:Signal recognition particle SRP54 subunit M-domain domain-containing protein n=1 Tax=Chara braunii TaxID=69332 RepID=A0A388M240_CHABU|nr:hypothetical protein CBR_g48179 [Chara braunii]|eukprot:GBG88648.1 hypothetical protein CBR_g48179 [Chara braunii]